MRFIRTISALSACVSLVLLVMHWMGLPASGGIGWRWVASERVTKSAHFAVGGLPADAGARTWTSMWGINRPEADDVQDKWSELEIVVRHETRSGLVSLMVTGDSEPEVDAFLATVRNDFDRTYATDREGARSSVLSTGEEAMRAYYWRQKYLWLLGVVLVVSAAIWVASRRGQRVSASDGA